MLEQIHILNGDALKSQLSDLPENNTIILREAFIEGPLEKDNFFKNRAAYIKEKFKATLEEYETKCVQEFNKIKNLSSDKEIVLWFEYDLFCQCNFWYACHEIQKIKKIPTISWVHPNHQDWSGFGKMEHDELHQIFLQRQIITKTELQNFSNLWLAYVNGNIERIKSIAQSLSSKYPKLEATIQAHINRINPEFLLNISRKYLQEITEKSFKSFFLKFKSEQGIYGFGDLHVKEYYQKAINQSKGNHSE